MNEEVVRVQVIVDEVQWDLEGVLLQLEVVIVVLDVLDKFDIFEI